MQPKCFSGLQLTVSKMHVKVFNEAVCIPQIPASSSGTLMGTGVAGFAGVAKGMGHG